MPVSVNISGSHLQSTNFVARLSELLNEFPLVKRGMLELEILETTAQDQPQRITMHT
jgi:EAL domain-containing protein (putative c-di-GMP-specific phosphodiesterase class I)